MNSITSRVAYLKGLVNGLEIDKDSKEGKVLLEIINLLYDMSDEISEVSRNQRTMNEYLDDIHEDLSDLVDNVNYDDYETLEDIEDNFQEVDCPNCGDLVYVDKDIMGSKEAIVCPSCHGKISLPIKDNKDN
ncbi:CD1247 N-terminal domain-containing protein [Clostridium tyrobutyricum]|jgi:formylmethanofuran dehydrogenase subunit E|nr:CD1247 N-terminal domain-containing protein [Clostridium tyrobutyricum]MBR9646914.1 hypothetical protein [Clostridium tyrobutyricum]MBV4415218.1 hypothetical protein [Clostridium tyrobutyricum]MBV4420889.1 hypothetical protein [Clostridium tyrobutyricum]MBV4423998.1 hypothetical protein [Clostridium tyrobutyricum]MBV4426875.1 hypothetical protein [Clostridium tyrobutyricum]